MVGAGRAALQALVESGEAAVNAGAGEAGVESLRNAAAARAEQARRTSRPPRSSRWGPPWCTPRRARTRRGRPRSTGASPRPRRRVSERWRPPRIASSATSRSSAATIRGPPTWLRTAGGAGRRRSARAGAGSMRIEGRAWRMWALTIGPPTRTAPRSRVPMRSGRPKQGPGRSAFLGRTQLLRNELDRADSTLDRGVPAARSERWTAFIACPGGLGRGGVDPDGRPGSGRRERSSTPSRSPAR